MDAWCSTWGWSTDHADWVILRLPHRPAHWFSETNPETAAQTSGTGAQHSVCSVMVTVITSRLKNGVLDSYWHLLDAGAANYAARPYKMSTHSALHWPTLDSSVTNKHLVSTPTHKAQIAHLIDRINLKGLIKTHLAVPPLHPHTGKTATHWEREMLPSTDCGM